MYSTILILLRTRVSYTARLTYLDKFESLCLDLYSKYFELAFALTHLPSFLSYFLSTISDEILTEAVVGVVAEAVEVTLMVKAARKLKKQSKFKLHENFRVIDFTKKARNIKNA